MRRNVGEDHVPFLARLLLEELKKSPEKPMLVKEGMEFLAEVDPDAALEWVKQNVEGAAYDRSSPLPEHEHDVRLSWR